MYTKSFYITDPVWNNAFSYDKRTNKELFVPELKEISSFDEIEIWDEIAFEEFNFDWKFSSNIWLKNFYKIIDLDLQKKWIKAPIYLFDNHNHAYYFWYKVRSEWAIWDNNILYHIDEHADTRDPNEYLLKPISYQLEEVFNFTNNILNVWNYIVPAQKEWLIWKVVQIRNETNLQDYLNPHPNPLPKGEGIENLPPLGGKYPKGDGGRIILNLDLDFFQKDLDYIDFNLKKKVILDIAKKASLITVSTSPFFINQGLAIKHFKELFG